MAFCDKCGKDLDEEVGMLVRVVDDEEGRRLLGKYAKQKINVDGVISWKFCYECILDSLMNTSQSVPLECNT